MSDVPIIQVKELHFSYPNAPEILRDIHFSVPTGQTIGLMGRSGSGKTTLLSVLMGLLSENKGQIYVMGEQLSALKRRGCGGYVPQNPSLMPWRSVLDNLLLPSQIRGLPASTARKNALDLLEQFGLAHTASWWPHQLSGGMAQRISVLRGVLFGSPLLFMDEPFSALDALTRREFQNWLAGLRSELGLNIILITHDVREAALLCDGVLVLQNGEGCYFPNHPDLEQQLEKTLLAAHS